MVQIVLSLLRAIVLVARVTIWLMRLVLTILHSLHRWWGFNPGGALGSARFVSRWELLGLSERAGYQIALGDTVVLARFIAFRDPLVISAHGDVGDVRPVKKALCVIVRLMEVRQDLANRRKNADKFRSAKSGRATQKATL
ncbi:hypothetical protein [Bradyrhizobium sp. CB2312]|uniref:hypothetical protein n=1 Tax=Bradyrhizobium sp. CB2312 TaxID=3039155 RepID=UPI0024B2608E|nr:hypothetical protein [Bradyrhizobium sp. CB2312]WFU71439.1 hypothetical protein QA642_40720 [Bradyrhizobium sp. CB2312]